MSNIFSFVGTVCRDAEVRVTPSGQSVCNVTVANNQGWGDKQTALFIRVALWGKKSEGTFPSFLVKGTAVFISGELSQREYQANDGTTKTSLELNANVIDLVGKREQQGAPQQNNQGQQNQYQNNVPQQNQQSPKSLDDFDVPF